MDGSWAGAGNGRRGFAQWLLDAGDLPARVRLSLLKNLYGTLAIFFGGIMTTASVSLVLAIRIGTPVFYVWATLELAVAALRLRVLLTCRRAVRAGRPGPVVLYAWLSIAWACGIGGGALIAMQSGDWLAAFVACVSAGAMLGGICFRYFAAPRLTCAMLIAAAIPISIGCLISGEPALIFCGCQIPFYVIAMSSGARQMNRVLVRALCAEQDQRQRARRDPLTGLLNRAGFTEAVAQRPAGAPLACYFIDLDGFKRVNDTLGHQAGDRLLVLVAERLRQALGADTILGRPGGDEFLAVTGDAVAADVRQRGDAIVTAVAGLPYIIEDQGVFIGASIGAAFRPGEVGDLDALIAEADEALYRAKAQDSSCCVVAAEAAEHPSPATSPLRACG